MPEEGEQHQRLPALVGEGPQVERDEDLGDVHVVGVQLVVVDGLLDLVVQLLIAFSRQVGTSLH